MRIDLRAFATVITVAAALALSGCNKVIDTVNGGVHNSTQQPAAPAPAPSGAPAGCDSQSYPTPEGWNCHTSSGWHFIHI